MDLTFLGPSVSSSQLANIAPSIYWLFDHPIDGSTSIYWMASSRWMVTLKIRLLGPILIRGLQGIKIWSICDHIKKIMTLDLSVNGFRGFNIFPPKSRESRISVVRARAYFLQNPKFSGGHKIRPVGLET